MRATTAVLSVAAILSASVSSVPVRRDVPVNLIPQFGLQSGVNPTGTGDCDGLPNAQGVPIKIPCQCPPDRNTFIQKLNANVAAGHVLTNPTVQLSFPTDNSKASQNARLNAAAVTLQNLDGPGKGCPIVSTTFQLQQAAINAGQDPNTVVAPQPGGAAASTPAPAAPPTTSAAPAPATTTAAAVNNAGSGQFTQDQVAALAPPLGFQSGLNPTGTGDCDGAVNGADGKPIKIPCACPPSQDVYIQQLTANVNAGKAINNPTVKVSFPTDNSAASQSARLTAASITLQNLNGPGKGCPVVSTTFSLQQAAINAGQNPATVVAPNAPKGTSTPAASSAAPATTPAPANNAATTTGKLTEAQIAALAPPLGFQSGVNPTGTGDCDGAVNGADGKPIKIPCACPPSQDVYIQQLTANVNAGQAINNPTVKVSFPTDNSAASQSARLTAASITLQNLNGPGKGCPVVSTTFSLQQAAINAGQNPATVVAPNAPKGTPAAAPASAAPATTSAAATTPANNAGSGQLSQAQVAALAPPLGFQSGVNPTGTGDCDGAVNGADGKPIKVPCACPPPQNEYVAQLTANANAGQAVNNPSVKVSFPTGSSNADKAARIQAALVTLQNLNGPGKGCPASSTTLLAQLKAVQ